jgi:hypothetical protein
VSDLQDAREAVWVGIDKYVDWKVANALAGDTLLQGHGGAETDDALDVLIATAKVEALTKARDDCWGKLRCGTCETLEDAVIAAEAELAAAQKRTEEQQEAPTEGAP